MFTWGLIVYVGLWLILADVGAVRKAKLMGNPIMVHIIVIGSGLLIHGGSADGAMAAIDTGAVVRLRCVTEPDAAQKVLLNRLGLTMPRRIRQLNEIPPMNTD